MAAPKILAFAGSTRSGSFNKKLIRLAADAARDSGAEVTLIDLRDLPLPLFDGDLEDKEGLPENAKKLKTLLRTHDGLLISAPEQPSKRVVRVSSRGRGATHQLAAGTPPCDRVRTRSHPDPPPRKGLEPPHIGCYHAVMTASTRLKPSPCAPLGAVALNVRRLILSLALAFGCGLISFVSAAEPPSTASAQRWLASLQTPAFSAPATWEAWQTERAGIRATLWKLLGELPPRPASVDVRVLSREEGDGYTLEKFEFDNGAGATVPGYLFLPKVPKAKVPAILYCHWHGGQYDNGKEEMLGNKDIPAPPGPALAKLGYAVLGIDAYCFGGRNGQGPGGTGEMGSGGELTAAKFQLWAGRSLWGMMMRDDLMALDYLCSRPEVDAARIGVTGMSMGSTRAWWIMALDDRPRAAVCVACMTRYQDLIRNERLRAHGIYYFVPGMLRHFDSEAVIALAAPRPMLFLTGDQDLGSPFKGVKTIEAKVRPVYQLAGKADSFQSVIYPDTGHVYSPDMWERMVKWMVAHVKSAK